MYLKKARKSYPISFGVTPGHQKQNGRQRTNKKKAKGNTLHSFEFFKLDAKAGNTGTRKTYLCIYFGFFFPRSELNNNFRI